MQDKSEKIKIDGWEKKEVKKGERERVGKGEMANDKLE